MTMIRTLPLIILLVISQSCQSQNKHGNAFQYMNVSRIIDGDTFTVDDGSEKGMIVRLIGVDAPESRNTGRRKIGFFGQQSKEYLVVLLEGQMVRLEYDVDITDPYKRTLAYVYLADGTFVNAELVKNGYAQVMTVPPNVRYVDMFLKLQQRARRFNRGLWDENQNN